MIYRAFRFSLALAALAAALVALTSLAAAEAGFGSRPLQEGAQGEDVASVQRLLAEMGIYGGPVTGYFGPLTKEAVQRFQRSQGLPAYGYLGSLTAKALEAARPATYHVVAPGESLSVIAARYGTSANALARLNGLANPNLLAVGQKLLLRGKQASPPAAAAAAPAAAPAGAAPAPAAGGSPGEASRPDPLRVYTPKPPSSKADQPSKVLALTFDDGPDPVLTPRVLDLLQKYKAKATFFVVGQKAERNPGLVKRMVEEGHEVANHSYTHPDLTRLQPAGILAELQKASDAIQAATGKSPAWFRPPGGDFDDRLVEAANRSGLRLALWTNIGPQGIAPPLLARRTLSAAREGAILMLHDTETATIEALNEILPKLTAGYRLVTLSEMAGLR